MEEHELESIVADWKRERPDVDMSPLRITLPLRRAMEVFERHRAGFLAEHGLSAATLDLLAVLRRRGAPFRSTPSELARSLLITAGGVSQRLDRLEAAGLVTRSMASEDRRSVYVELTERGREVVDEVLGPYMEHEADLLQRFTAKERATLSRLLSRLAYEETE